MFIALTGVLIFIPAAGIGWTAFALMRSWQRNSSWRTWAKAASSEFFTLAITLYLTLAPASALSPSTAQTSAFVSLTGGVILCLFSAGVLRLFSLSPWADRRSFQTSARDVFRSVLSPLRRELKSFARHLAALLQEEDASVKAVLMAAMKVALATSLIFLISGGVSTATVSHPFTVRLFQLSGLSIVFALAFVSSVTWAAICFLTGQVRIGQSIKLVGDSAGIGTGSGFLLGSLVFFCMQLSGEFHGDFLPVFMNLSVLGAVAGFTIGLINSLYSTAETSRWPILSTLALPGVALLVASASGEFASPRLILQTLLDFTDSADLTAPESAHAKDDTGSIVSSFSPSFGWYLGLLAAGTTAITFRRLVKLYAKPSTQHATSLPSGYRTATPPAEQSETRR